MKPHDALDDLLRRADAAAGEPGHAGNLATCVRRRRTNRVRRRVATTSVAACLAVGLAVWQVNSGSTQTRTVAVESSPTPVIDAASVQRELEQFERSADARLAAVDAYLNRPVASADLDAETISAPDPVMELHWQREQAALILVRQGDRLAQELNLPKPAAVAYRQASETFPDTHWAAVAQARLLATTPPTGMN